MLVSSCGGAFSRFEKNGSGEFKSSLTKALSWLVLTALLIGASHISAAVRTIVVDTDSSQNPDYTSLSQAIIGEAGTLSEPLIIRARASSGAPDTNPVDISGINTTASNNLTIILEKGYDLDVTATKKLGATIRVSSDFVTLKGEGGRVIHRNNYFNATTAILSNNHNPGSYVVIENLWVEAFITGWKTAYGIRTQDADVVSVIQNNVVTGFVGEEAYALKLENLNYVYNNTLVRNESGLKWYTQTGEFYNNISVDNADTDYYHFQNWGGIQTGHNITADSTGPNEEFQNQIIRFLDKRAKAFSLHPDDHAALGKGFDLSEVTYPLTNDFDSIERQGQWDIGAYSFNPATVDLDNDGMSDRWEGIYGLDIQKDDSGLDADADNLSNLQEYQHGSSPKQGDTDLDGVQDADEVAQGKNPLVSNTVLEIVVDTDASTNPDYTSLRAAVESLRGILTQPVIIRARASTGVADTEPVYVASIFSTPDTSVTILFEDSYSLNITATKDYFIAFEVQSDFVTVRGEGGQFTLHNDGLNASYSIFSSRQAKHSVVTFENLTIRGDISDDQPSYGIKTVNEANVHIIRNNVVSGFVGSDAYGIFAYYDTYVYNNTVVGNEYGLRLRNPSGEAFNNLAVGNVVGDYYPFQDWSDIVHANNISSDVTAENASDRNKAVEFMGVGDQPYSLSPNDETALDRGTNLSSVAYPFDYDHDGETRIGGWDIGAYNYNASLNEAPIISSSPELLGTEGVEYLYQVAATDPNGDALTYALQSSPQGMTIDSSSGLLSWIPGSQSVGSVEINLSVSDGQLETVQSYTLVVESTNSAPIANAQSLSLNEDESLNITLTGSDADNDSLSYSIASQAINGLLSGTGANFVYTPNANFNGVDSFNFTVNDGVDVSTATINLIVQSVNDAPELISSAITSGVENTAYVYDVNATDADGDDINYALTTAPAGMSIDSASGLINWLPGYDAAGTHTVQISIDDGQGSAISYSYSLTITNANREPVVNSIELMSGAENTAYAYDVNATDADGDSLTYTLTTGPIGMTIDPVSGLINWLPGFDVAGSHAISVTVSDDQGASAVHSYVLTILNINRAPVFNTTQLPSATQGLAYSASIDANDPDGDTLTYTLLNQPATMTINTSNGDIDWPLVDESVGTHSFQVVVSDGSGAEANLSVDLVVEKLNAVPVVTSKPHTVAVVGEQYSYTINATDDDGQSLSYSLANAPSFLNLSPSGTLSGTPLVADLGEHLIDIEVSDGTGSVTQSYSLSVIELPESDPGHWGKDFWFGDMMTSNGGGNRSLLVFITSNVDTQGTIEFPAWTGRSPQSFSVQAGDVSTIDIYKDALYVRNDEIHGRGVHVSADDEVAVYVLYYSLYNTDAQSLLPTSSLGTEYRMSGYRGSFADSGNQAEYKLVATEDNTQVSIFPKNKLDTHQGTIPAGQEYVVSLNKGQTYNFNSSGLGGRVLDQAGTYISSDKPIGAFIAHHCIKVPSDELACDRVAEQMLPISFWGNKYALVPYYSRYKDLVRVVAHYDNTIIEIDKKIVKSLASGGVFEMTLTEASFLTTTHPVTVTQFSTGNTFDVLSRLQDDHFNITWRNQYNISDDGIPIEEPNFQTSYSITIDPAVDHNTVFLVVPDAAVGSVVVDGELLSSDSFDGEDSGGYAMPHYQYAAAQIVLSPGEHTITASHPFAAYKNQYGLQYYGDPFAVVLSPTELTNDHYIFTTPIEKYVRHFVNITIPKDAGAVTINGEEIDAAYFKGIPNSDFLYARLGVKAGRNEIKADKEFGIQVYGYEAYDSYGFNGGYGLPNAAPISDISVSVDDLFPHSGEALCATAQALDLNGLPANDVPVKFTLTGMHDSVITEFTSRNGLARYCLNGYLVGGDQLLVEAAGYQETFDITWQASRNESKPPVVTSMPPLTVIDGEVYTYQMSAIDPEQETLTYTLFDGPANMSVDPANGNLEWLSTMGTYDVTVDVSDIAGNTTRQSYVLLVNALPIITQYPDERGSGSNGYSSQIKGEDPDGGEIRYEIISTAPCCEIHPFNGTITAESDLTGDFSLTIRVWDDEGYFVDHSFNLEIIPYVIPAYLNTDWSLRGYAGETLYFQVDAQIATDEVLTHKFTYNTYVLPSEDGWKQRTHVWPWDIGMSIDEHTGLITWEPGSELIGKYFYLETIVEGEFGNAKTTHNYDFLLLSRPPVLVSTPLTTAFEGSNYQYVIQAENPDNGDLATITLIDGPDGMTLDLQGDLYYLNWLPDAGNCQHTVILELDDGISDPVQTQFTLDVYNAPKRMNRFQCSVDSEFCAAR